MGTKWVALASWIGLSIASNSGAQEPQATDRRPEIQGNVLFEELFNDQLATGWTWLREQPAQWCVRHGALEIRVRPGLADTVENALVREVPQRGQEPLAFEVTLTNLSRPTNQYEQAGLTWYSDGRPVFKLVKELVDGAVVIIPGKKPVEGDTVQLRLEVQGNRYTAFFRTDLEKPFEVAGKGELPVSEREQISLQCYNGPSEGEHWIRFDDFRIVKEK